MHRHPDKDTANMPASSSRSARLHVLLFAGTALGTTILTVLGAPETKLPPFHGE